MSQTEFCLGFPVSLFSVVLDKSMLIITKQYILQWAEMSVILFIAKLCLYCMKSCNQVKHTEFEFTMIVNSLGRKSIIYCFSLIANEYQNEHRRKCWLKVHCGMYIPLSDDKHRFVWDNSKNALRNRDKILSETKFGPRKNPKTFFDKYFFW